jgi:hypothetical protein
MATEMMKKGNNMFHVHLKNIRSFNPYLGGFIASNYRNLDKDLTQLMKKFIESLNLGVLKNGVYFNLIGGRR